MTRRNKIIVIVVAVFLVAAVAAILLFLFRTPAAPRAPAQTNAAPPSGAAALLNTATSADVTAGGVVGTTASGGAAPAADPRAGLERLAAAFAERFGSFSNEGNFENVLDLKPFMTVSMQEWANRYAANAAAEQQPQAVYSGTTTRALTAAVADFDETSGRAQATVKTQRREVSGAERTERVYYQDIDFVFLKENGVWKVDSAAWK